MDCLLVAAAFSWLSPSSWWAIAQVVIGLGAVIFVHELGHFLVAKACGVKCEKFLVGFDFFEWKIGDRVIIPKQLLSWQWGETEYGLGSIPLGGYVKMLGQDDNPANMEKEMQRSMADGAEFDPNLPEGFIDRSKLDPRSFMAKSVPQRMAIISAGVIFNLIFAALFAAIAFRSSVDYAPTMIGDVVPAGPAWEADLAGKSITRVGDKKVEGYFTYMDMAQEIAMNGDQHPMELDVRDSSGQTQSLKLTPRKGMLRRAKDLPLLGLRAANIPKLSAKDPTIVGHPALVASPPFEGGDLITDLNGTPIETGFDLRKTLAHNFDRIAEFVVERKVSKESDETTNVTISVQTNPRRELGFGMKWSPVAAVQQGSPAAIAGIKINDKIEMINGEDPGDLMTLEQRMTQIARDNPGQSVTFSVNRGGEDLDLAVVPRLPRLVGSAEENHPIGIDSIGIAISLNPIVNFVAPDSRAAESGLKPGDELVGFEFMLSDEQKKNPIYSTIKSSVSFGDTVWSEVYQLVQVLPVGSKFGLKVKGQKDQVKEIESFASTDYFLHTRGVRLQPLMKTYKSDNWGDALALGAKQTVSDASRVWKFLVKLIKGEISPTNLGGPGTIAMVATSEAGQGTSRLLLFLTLLSANLAIVNFLPIPILDGGHMLFLAYEGLFRRPVTPAIQERLMIGGMIFLIALMAFVLGLDALRMTGLI